MRDEYNQKIVGILQGRATYSVPNHGQMSRVFNEQTFYEYRLITEQLTHSGLKITLDVEQATRFATYNGLRVMNSLEAM